MKIMFEEGDLVYYEGKPVTVVGPPVRVDGVPGHHVKHENGDMALVPAVVLLTPETSLMNRCTEALLAHEKWESDLLISDQSVFLETLDTESYASLVEMQKTRLELLTKIASLSKRKN